MHNKCWIADGRLAICGGRNIGDAYFDASAEANFQDIDVLAAGAAVAAAGEVFDRTGTAGRRSRSVPSQDSQAQPDEAAPKARGLLAL